ncbi:D-amino acid aminotransferase [Orrella sp. JC864]|uniref:D-amino acid aminotransferase n=1 Tax=Orrella sp. JC864 TaxID=3120298 RepID=UPI00300A8A9C
MSIPGVAPGTPAFLNGEFLPIEQARVSVLDRGFLFGDGVYEVVPVYGGRPLRMAEHLARLARSLAAVRIASPRDEQGWRALVAELARRSPVPDCLVYLQVTRGVARRDHAFPVDPAVTPTVFGMASPFSPPDAALRSRGLHALGIEDERWLNCHIKATSLLGNVLARQRAVDAGVDEVLQFRDGLLTEGAASNIWVVRKGILMAPPVGRLLLEGIRYGLTAELAQEAGVPFEARPLSLAEVRGADEVLVTSASREILPIVRLDGEPVGAGVPGPVYARLRAGYDARIAALRAQPAV